MDIFYSKTTEDGRDMINGLAKV